MDFNALTPLYLARHLDYEREHRRYEKLRHASTDAILAAMQERLTWQEDGYTIIIRVHERHVFRPKLLLLAHPDLHEQYSDVIQVRQLLVMATSTT